MKTAVRVAAAMALLIAPVGARAGTQARVTGRVTDSDGHPIEGATVTVTTPAITSYRMSVKTAKDGQYGFIINDATLNYHLRFEREGYKPAEADKKFSIDEITTVDQRLSRPAPAAPAAPALLSASQQATLAYNEGVDLLNSGKRDAAEAKLREAVGKSPDLPQAWEALATIAYEKKDWPGVLEYGQKATDLDPTLDSLYRMMGDAAEQTGDKKAAGEWKKKYEEANPDDPEVLYQKGAAAFNKKQLKEAEEYFQKAVAAKPDYAMAHYELGMVSFNLKKPQAAREHLEKYLQLDPGGKEAATAREILSYLK